VEKKCKLKNIYWRANGALMNPSSCHTKSSTVIERFQFKILSHSNSDLPLLYQCSSGFTPVYTIVSLVPYLYYTEMRNYGYECHSLHSDLP
jgi:hypothetical protein